MPDKVDVAFPREREDHAASQGFMEGIVLGSLLGVVLALVFAPMRGKEARAAVAHKAMDAKDKAMHLVQKGAPGHSESTNILDHDAAIERQIGS
jgi:gas vesicle protein